MEEDRGRPGSDGGSGGMPADGIADTGGVGGPNGYWAVIFTSLRTAADEAGYGVTADRMAELAALQPGFLGVETARGPDGVGITVSYWRSLDDVAAWKAHAEHRIAQRRGAGRWYRAYRTRVARVAYEYAMDAPAPRVGGPETGSLPGEAPPMRAAREKGEVG